MEVRAAASRRCRAIGGQRMLHARWQRRQRPGARLCTTGDTDINGELVRNGHVFAEHSLFARYAGHEREAKSARSDCGSAVARPSGPSTAPRRGRRPSAALPTDAPSKAWCDGDRAYVLPGTP
jgi:endonuclease YncB( thermonuclease family)